MVCATGCPQSPNIILYYVYFMASGVKSGVYCYLHCISIYNLVELKSFVRKLLTQFARDRRETRIYYRAPHGDGYKGVDGR